MYVLATTGHADDGIRRLLLLPRQHKSHKGHLRVVTGKGSSSPQEPKDVGFGPAKPHEYPVLQILGGPWDLLTADTWASNLTST